LRLAITSAVLLIITAGLLVLPAGRDLDRALVDWAHGLSEQHRPINLFMELGTDIGKTRPMMVAIFLPAAFGNEFARGTAKVAFVSVFFNQVATSGLKWLTNRPRPDGDNNRSNSSFPSGHASGAVGLAWILAHRHRRLSWLWWSLAVWISISRVFLERHYFSDICAGALLGILFAAIALHFEDRLAGWTWARDRDA
jgi:membrane-associated phospholipid phosphatase